MEAVQLDTMTPRPYRIQRVHHETRDTFTMELAATGGGDIPPYKPGQFNMLYVFGAGEVPISISGDPGTPETLVHTTRAVGTVTSAMARLKPGHVLGVRGPYGNSWPVEEAEGNDLVIVAGGIGAAPLRPLLYSVMDRRNRFGKVVILYGTRTPDDILFSKDLKQLRSRFDVDVLMTVDRATGDWRGHVGVVTKMIPHAPFDPYQATAYVCGPEIMMYYTLEALEKRGVPRDQIYMSMERNMKCALGHCGRCQFGRKLICRDGPVFRYDTIASLLDIREV